MRDETGDAEKANGGERETSALGGQEIRQFMQASLAALGIASSELEWLPLDESNSIVRHWVDELGAQKYGRLALIAPSSGAIRDEIPVGSLPSWLVRDSTPTYILFQNYKTTGLARSRWNFVVDNMAALALLDGNGFAAVSDEMEGVLLVDIEEGQAATTLVVEGWGSRVRKTAADSGPQ